MISAIFNVVSEAITQFASSLSSALISITAMFWDAEAGTLTTLGTLGLIGLGIGLVYFAFRLIRSLMRLR